MKNSVIGWRGGMGSIGALLLLFLSFASSGWATGTSCATAATLASINTATTGPGTGSGCYDVDKSFTNLAVANSGTGGTTQTTATDNLATTASIAAGSTVTSASAWTATGTFTPVGTDWNLDSDFGATEGGVIGGAAGLTVTGGVPSGEGMVVNSTGTFIAYGTAPDNPQNVSGPTGFHSNITSVTLNTVTGTTGTPTTFGTDTIVVEEIFCVGTLACTATDEVTLEGEIAASGSSAVTYTCTKGSGVTAADGTCATVAGTSATFTFGTGFPSVPTINLVSTYTLTTSGTSDTGNTDSLTKFADVFGEDEISPEPSTFILLGSALALIGLLRLRARRKSAAAAIL